MPELRIAKTRQSLDPAYRYGDMGKAKDLAYEIGVDFSGVHYVRTPFGVWTYQLINEPHRADAQMDADGYGAGV